MRPGAIVSGAILLGIGIIMLLDNTGMLHVRLDGLIAPLILITIGSAKVLDRRDVTAARCRRSTGGFWLIGIGVWMLVSQTHLFGLSFGTSWPLLIILAGLLVVMRGIR